MSQWDEVVEVYSAVENTDGIYAKRDWTGPVLVLSSRASVQPDRNFEMRSPERDLAQERLHVYLPYTELVDDQHRVKWRGDWYEVDGPPDLWPYGSTRHTHLIIWRAKNG
ncbi:head-to-tail connector complex protein [Streptomyces phage Ibantik]|uniref:Head-to-tail connector complex protein n=1 Tax=Streptomyces phage Ibantik TaxID=2182397 RepID=A0A2U8UNP0_9CAUD|nr:head-to-tail connector complex protein [Streptomyces phage Ibantik]AWN05295.1 head-to-tail connector complex protein [Streptomyces phage Ibantik]